MWPELEYYNIYEKNETAGNFLTNTLTTVGALLTVGLLGERFEWYTSHTTTVHPKHFP